MLAFRAAVAVYAFAILVNTFTVGVCFFTNWTWALLVLYFAAASAASGLHLRYEPRGEAQEESEGQKAGKTTEPPSPSWHAAYARLLQVLMSTLAASAVMVAVVFWLLLLPSDDSPHHEWLLNFDSYNMHAMSVVFVVAELAFNSTPMRAQDAALAVLFPAAFAAFTVLRVAVTRSMRPCLTEPDPAVCEFGARTDGPVIWPYFFMDTVQPLAVLWYFASGCMFLLAYFVVFGVRTFLLWCAASSMNYMSAPDNCEEASECSETETSESLGA